jgi:hypothetical protein
VSEPGDFSWLPDRVLRPARSGGPPLAADPRRLFRASSLVPCPRCHGTGTVGGYTSDDPPEWEEGAWTCGNCGTYRSVPADTPIVDRPPVPSLLSADPKGVLSAEAAARTSVERLIPWGVPATDRIVWRVGGPPAEPMRAYAFADVTGDAIHLIAPAAQLPSSAQPSRKTRESKK